MLPLIMLTVTPKITIVDLYIVFNLESSMNRD
jgi:hypothetical protein